MLVYRLFRCCHKAVTKLLHTILLLCAVPCIVVGTIAVFDFHNLREKPFPNLYSLHSWCGLITIGLFGMQVIFYKAFRRVETLFVQGKNLVPSRLVIG